MKSQLIFALCATLLSFNVQATSIPAADSSSTPSLRDQIVTLVEHVEMSTNNRIEEDVHICFRVDGNSQVALHSVETSNQQLKTAIEKHLEHAAVKVETSKEDQFYWITIKYRVV
jgi:hypothetical protein